MAAAGPASRPGDGDAIKLEARLTGFQEVPSKLTDAAGRFTAVIDPSRTMIEFTLTFADLSTPTLFAHIHFAQRRVNGGIILFLCNNSPDGPQPRPCPSPGGTVTGTIRAEDVVGPGLNAGEADQGITPGSLDDAFRAILNGNGAAYANAFRAIPWRRDSRTDRDRHDGREGREMTMVAGRQAAGACGSSAVVFSTLEIVRSARAGPSGTAGVRRPP
jgi:hypothetical protein